MIENSSSDIRRNCSIGTETKESFNGRQGSSKFTIESILGSLSRGERVTSLGGEADLEVYREVIREKFGEGTEWQEALDRRKEAYSPAKRGTWREPGRE